MLTITILSPNNQKISTKKNTMKNDGAIVILFCLQK